MRDTYQFFEKTKMYILPARVVRNMPKFGIFVRLFLGANKVIDNSISSDKSKNIALKKTQHQDLNEGDFVLVAIKGMIANEFLSIGEIGEIKPQERFVNFDKKIEKEEYQNLIAQFNTQQALFDSLKKNKEIEEQNNNMLTQISKNADALSNKAKELNEIINNIDLAKDFLKQEQDNLLNFQKENQWLEQIKPYIISNTNNITDNYDVEVITKNQSKSPFDKITSSLKDRFNLSDDFIHCYLLSLFTSLMQGRFLLLTGHIGTGKSSIIKETGKLLGGQTNMVAVRPAWLDASDLLGYFDPINNRYHSTDFVRFIKQENNNHINIILLDELNIARIENYGADILACLAEIGERDQEQNKIHLFNQDLQELIHTYQLFEELNDIQKQKYQHILDRIKQSSSIIIPDNVLICGTLNIDGSTENLSPKMIDRSFMLKFPDFDGQLGEIKEIKEQEPLLISQIIHSARKRDVIPVQQWNDFYKTYIEKIKDSLIPISNRVAKDYLVFCQFAEFFGIDDKDKVDALFFYTRILPRLRIERLDDKNKEVLNSFENNELFSSFIKEIKNSHNGNFIDYQHICG